MRGPVVSSTPVQNFRRAGSFRYRLWPSAGFARASLTAVEDSGDELSDAPRHAGAATPVNSPSLWASSGTVSHATTSRTTVR